MFQLRFVQRAFVALIGQPIIDPYIAAGEFALQSNTVIAPRPHGDIEHSSAFNGFFKAAYIGLYAAIDGLFVAQAVFYSANGDTVFYAGLSGFFHIGLPNHIIVKGEFHNPVGGCGLCFEMLNGLKIGEGIAERIECFDQLLLKKGAVELQPLARYWDRGDAYAFGALL